MNNQIFFLFHNLAHQSLFLDKLMVFFAVYFPYAVIILAGLFILFHHEVFKAENPFRFFLQKKREILMVFSSGVLAWIVAFILKILFQIPRPFIGLTDIQPLFMKTTFSFPSEHAMFFSALSFEIFLLHPKAGYIFIIATLIIGLARIVAGVHYPMDILAGFVFGFAVAFIVKKLSTKYSN